MNIKKLLIVLPLLISANRCKDPRSIPSADRKLEVITEHCDVEFAFDKNGDIITERSACWCHDIHMSINGIFRITKDMAKPIEYCDRAKAYPNYNELSAFREKLLNAINRNMR